MLLLGGKTFTDDGITVYSDHADPNQFWYLPAPVALEKRGDDPREPQFSFIKFREAKAGPNGFQGGGFLAFTAALPLDTTVEGSLLAQVRHHFPEAETPRLAPVPFDDGTVQCVALNLQGSGGTVAPTGTDGAFTAVEKILGARTPSLAGNNDALFGLTLSQEGAILLEQAFDHELSPIGVIYELKYTGVRPALDVVITADLSRVYDSFSVGLTASVYWVSAGIDATFEKLKQDGAIQIQVTNLAGDLATAEQEKQALELFKSQILADWFKPSLSPTTAPSVGVPTLPTTPTTPTTPTGPTTTKPPTTLPGTPGVPTTTGLPTTTKPTTPGLPGQTTPTTPTGVPATTTPAGTGVLPKPGLPQTLPGLPKPAGTPVTAVVTTPAPVPQTATVTPPATTPPGTTTPPKTTPPVTTPPTTTSPGTATTLPVTTTTPATKPATTPATTGGANDTIGKVADAAGKVAEAVKGAASAASPFGLALRLKFVHQEERKTVRYEYHRQDAVQRTYAPQGYFGLLLKGIDRSKHFLDVDLDDPFFRSVAVSVTPPHDFATIGLTSVHVALDYGEPSMPGGPKHGEFLFEAANAASQASQKWQVAKDEAAGNSYRYHLDYHFDPDSGWDGEALSYSVGPGTSEDLDLFVNPHELLGFLTIDIKPGHIDWTVVESIELDLTYAATSGWRTNRHFDFHADTKPQVWKLRVADKAESTFRYRLTHHLKDGTTVVGVEASSNATALLVNDPFAPPLAIEVQALLDPAKTQQALLELKHDDREHAWTRSESVRFAPTPAGAPAAQTVRLLRLDPTLGKYQYRLTRVDAAGQVVRGPWTDSSEASLFITELGVQ